MIISYNVYTPIGKRTRSVIATVLKCPVETEGLLKVTGSRVHCTCKSRNILELLQDSDVVTTNSW